MKTLRAKVLGGSLRNSASSLAVFYVEQVALNRHVSPQPQLLLLCRKSLPKSRSLNFARLPSLRQAIPQFPYENQLPCCVKESGGPGSVTQSTGSAIQMPGPSA